MQQFDSEDFALSTPNNEQVQSFLNSMDTVDLEDMSVSTIRVGIQDYRMVHDPQFPGGMRRQANPRIAEIINFVPMRIFNQMLASRNKIMRQREKFLQSKAEEQEQTDPMIEWMLRQVLEVWKLTPGEEDMTLDRLENGLDFQKIYRLFTLFFDKMMKQMSGSVGSNGKSPATFRPR